MMKLSECENLLSAQRLGEDKAFHTLSIDTRTLKPGSLFVAFKGDQVDGHDYIQQAFEKGAAAVMVTDKSKVPSLHSALIVRDPIEAMTTLAKHYRQSFDIPCVGITGSCGKTSVKNMVGHILNSVIPTLVSKGNLNNQLGVPLTLSELETQHLAMVIEMGASAKGDIAHLSQMARPTIALINNVYRAHLEGFGSLEGVAAAKGEIYEALGSDGVAVLNLDSPYAAYWEHLIGDRQTITFGHHPRAMVQALDIQHRAGYTAFTLVTPNGQIKIQLPLLGEHNVMNALAAVACVYPFDLSLEAIAAALQTLKPVKGRLVAHTLKDNVHLIDDTYNANPDAMAAAIDVLSRFDGERLLVIGDMAELGPDASVLHQNVGLQASKKGIQGLWGVGKLSKEAVSAFGEAGRWYESKEGLIEALQMVKTPITILVKGSRSAGMEKVVEGLIQYKESI